MQEDYISLNEIDENITVKDVYTEAVASKIVQDDVHIEESVYIDLQSISHADLSDRTLPNQHTIASVQGLRDELDRLEFAHTHVSGTGYAQYYPWVDSEPVGHTDRIGCFVSFVDDGSGKIKLCSSADEDILGVIVSEESAGFIGNAIDSSDISKYGLVCLLGTVDVRVTDGIQVGDYIVPNALGIASGVSTTESYAQIITITNSDYYTLNHTPIANPKIYTLDVNGTLVDEVVIGESATGKIVTLDGTVLTAFVGDDGYRVGDRLCALYDYVKYQGLGYKVNAIKNGSGVSYATIGLIPNGNALHRLQSDISNALDRIATLDNNTVAAMNRANDAYNLAELVSGDVNTSIFEQIQESIDKSESANNTANDAVNTVNQMSQTVVNIENVANNAKKEAEDNSSEIESLWAENGSLQQDIQSLRGKIDKYAVGPYSQAYGLTFDHATKILPTDIVYVPTENHDEQYQKDTGEVVYHFSRGYSYVWGGSSMLWSPTTNVLFYGVYISGDEVNKYWYTDCSTDVVQGNTTYPKKTLFVWSGGEWVAVATLDNNTLSRVVSLVQQTENDVKIQITGVRGDYVEISARVDANETAIANVAKLEDSIAGIQQRANKNEASIEQFVQFGYEVLNYEEIDEAPTNGPFYIDKPECDGEKWVFTGSSSESVGNINGIEYCYAKNVDDDATYYQYTCEDSNKWYRLEIGRSSYLAGIKQTADANGAKVSMIVDSIGQDGVVNAASIVAAITEDESSIGMLADNIALNADNITIDASKILLNGEATFTTTDSSNGTTKIDGANIATGTIGAQSIQAGAITVDHMTADSIDAIAAKVETATIDTLESSNYVKDTSGLKITLTDGAFDAKNFKIVEDGSVTVSGNVTAISGAIGGFTLKDGKLYTGIKSNLSYSATDGVYIGTDGISVSGIATNPDSTYYNANVTLEASTGKLIANNAEITGKIAATSGYIGDASSGFAIASKAIHSEYDVSDINTTNDYHAWNSLYMGSYNSLEQDSSLYGGYFVDSENNAINRDYVYVGTDGIGTYHVNEFDFNGITSASQTWMANGKLFSNSAEITGRITATSGYIGDDKNGITIGYSIKSGKYALMYNQNIHDGSSNLNAEGVYVGPDGIGLGGGKFYVNKTGALHMRTGTIGYGDYKWTIFGNQTKAGLYYGSDSLAGTASLGSSVTDCYIGTNGISCSNNGIHDYTTVIKSGSVLTYGDSKATGNTSNYNRATQVYQDGIRFFHADSSKISSIDSLLDYQVGGIGIGIDKSLNISANKLNFSTIASSSNTMSLTFGISSYALEASSNLSITANNDFTIIAKNKISLSTANGIWVNGSKGITGWIKTLAYANGATSTQAFYFHYVDGLLVEVTATDPGTNATWILGA